MAYERFANGGLSSLAAGIDNSVTSLTVKSAVGFPTAATSASSSTARSCWSRRARQDLHGHAGAGGHVRPPATMPMPPSSTSLTAGSLAQRDIEQFATGPITATRCGRAGWAALSADRGLGESGQRLALGHDALESDDAPGQRRFHLGQSGEFDGR